MLLQCDKNDLDKVLAYYTSKGVSSELIYVANFIFGQGLQDHGYGKLTKTKVNIGELM